MASREARIRTAQRVEIAVRDAVTKSLWETEEPRGPDPYKDGQYSYFADLLTHAQQKSTGPASVDDRPTAADLLYESHDRPEATFSHRGRQYSITGPAPSDAPDWQKRLHGVQRLRPRADITSGSFVPTGAPTRVGRAFAEGVAARAVVANLLNRQPLPEFGMQVEEPRISTPPSVDVQATEGGAVDETDPVREDEISAVVTVSGQVDMSRQAFDRSSPQLDRVIASELGRQFAERLDELILNGSGASGEPLGLLNITGGTANTYTDTSPTVAEFWRKLMELVSDTSTAWKNNTGTVLLHLRRLAWLYSALTADNDLVSPPVPDGIRLVATGSMPTTLGGGTEDAIIALDPNAVKLYLDEDNPVRFSIDQNSLSGNLKVRISAYAPVALSAEREPAAIGKLTGAGLVAPSFT